MAARRGGEVPVPVEADAFGDQPKNLEVMHRALRTHAQRIRQGTQNTKTRGEVAYSTVKLYRQKGTGRARAGSRGSSIRRGGGVAFGPRARSISRRLSRRERRQALRGALASKAADNRVLRAESWGEAAKTKDRVAWLAAAGLQGRVLLLDVDPPVELLRSARNVPGVQVARADSIGFYDVAVADHLVATADALEILQGNARRG